MPLLGRDDNVKLTKDLKWIKDGPGEDDSDPPAETDHGLERRRQKASCVQRAGAAVSETLEKLFYKLGFNIAKRPWTVILCTFLVSALCGIGMIRFEVKDSSEPIWIPEDSPVLTNQRWVEENFPLKYRFNQMIIEADNVLNPEVLKQMLRIDRKVKNLQEVNNTEIILNFNWSTICIRIPDQCWSNSILELWEFDEDNIESLNTNQQVIDVVNEITTSPVYNSDFKYTDWLGGIEYDSNGRVVSARAAKLLYVITATSTDELNTKIIAPDLLWETKFISLGKSLTEEKLAPIKRVDVSAIRSFRDESDNSFEADVMLLMAGVCIIIAYVAIILGKFNEVEHKVYLALIGVFGIGLASLVSYGLASAIGMFYGPIHPILPFLLLGLGVDDMFVIIEAWSTLTASEKKKDLKIKVAIAMKNAGVSITVTSITDFVAFAIGASTTLPALKSFCVYAALGILSLFIIQSTFFVAWLTIDQRRQDASRDACCIWIKYSNFEPNPCSQRLFLPWFLKKFFARFLITLPIKVLVSTLMICMLAISGYGTYLLRTDSDLAWFLPIDSYLTKYLDTQEKYFDDGVHATLYTGKVDYYNDTERLASMITDLKSSEYVKTGSVNDWYDDYMEWLKHNDQVPNMAYHFGLQLGGNNIPVTEAGFYKMLGVFVGTDGRHYFENLKWNDTEFENPRFLLGARFQFKVRRLKSSADEVDALKYFEGLTKKYFDNEAFVWSISFRNTDTNRVIQKELYTNIGLAFAAVFVVTLMLVANLWVCIMVCVCVIITLVNVCGFMHFWGLTIDTLTSILLILSIGLAIDYSAHIGHKFMTIGGSRNERAKYTVATIGPAIINGGFSTFLAFILLATSNSYVFITFFKVFFLVVTFGLFNGMCVLPVLLSWFGPEPYLNAKQIELTSSRSTKLKEFTRPRLQQATLEKVGEMNNETKINEPKSVDNPDGENSMTNEREIGLMLEKLEAQTLKSDTVVLMNPMQLRDIQYQRAKSAHTEMEHPRTHKDIIEACEQYLLKRNNSVS